MPFILINWYVEAAGTQCYIEISVYFSLAAFLCETLFALLLPMQLLRIVALWSVSASPPATTDIGTTHTHTEFFSTEEI